MRSEERIDLKKAIIKTIVFFDIFDHPLTIRELWRECGFEIPFSEFFGFVANARLKILEERHGYYFLRGRSVIVNERKARYNATCSKYKKVLKYSRIFSLFSGIRMIAVSNMIGNENIDEDGDIDLFIITDKNKVWRARFYLAMLGKIFFLRPRGGKRKDKFCFNFFVDDSFLDLGGLRIEDDIYFDHWMSHLFPVYNRDHTYEVFMGKNPWLKRDLPNWRIKTRGHRYILSSRPVKATSILLNILFLPGERFFRFLQFKILPPVLKDNMNLDTRVVADVNILKLHSKDNREKYSNIFKQRINQLT